MTTEQQKVLQLITRLQTPGGLPEPPSLPLELRDEFAALVAKWHAIPAVEQAEISYAAWYADAGAEQQRHSPSPSLHKAKRLAKTEAEKQEIARLIHDEITAKIAAGEVL